MPAPIPFLQRLKDSRPILLDAAMGTALHDRGLQLGEEDAIGWSIRRREEVLRVHRAHREAGAELLLANTFGSRAPKADELNAALLLARESGARFVAVTLWPGLPEKALAQSVREAESGGADLIWLETAMRFDDAERALRVAKEVCALPIAATLALAAFPSRAGGLAGFIKEARAGFARLAEKGAAIAGLNCGPWDIESGRAPPVSSPGCAALSPDPSIPLQPLELAELVSALASELPIPFALKPDAGCRSPQAWARLVTDSIRAGAKLAGGCCGTDARHLLALRQSGYFTA